MDTTWHRSWFMRRVQIADEIVGKHATDGEADAEILLCCAIGALAAKMWPGRGIDQFRFIEFLVRFSPANMGIRRISIPLLIPALKEKDEESAQKLINEFYHPRHEYDSKLRLDEHSLPVSLLPRMLQADQIDQTEEAIMSVLENYPQKELRRYSHAAIIYQDLRSGLVHEYNLSPRLSRMGIWDDDNTPNYANVLIMPDENSVAEVAAKYNVTIEEARSSLSENQRRLHLPYRFIRDLVVKTAETAFDYWDSGASLECSNPTSWWING